MTSPRTAHLSSRAVIAVAGLDWRSFLQGLLTQDVETLAPGELRFAGLLTPQGRLLYDLFVAGLPDGALLDVAAQHRDAIVTRLSMYRLRAKVEIGASDLAVGAVFSPDGAPVVGEGFYADPRLPALGARVYGPTAEPDATEDDYDAHRLALGVPGPADWLTDKAYPIEADFDLLAGIDFKKGCFVGQETTSRMKRRGTIKNRMLPIAFDGPAPAFGAEVLAGELRAGEVLSGGEGRAMALLRLDRIEGADLTVDGRPVRVERPDWVPPTPVAAPTV
ncbi:glycine cleavage system protein T [Caulobacter sp. D4A]|uniref:CAF17-like 4Fe-4S cluster assembly/insertion protein YgfZ n=1 Tax=unclassified Caulobacter TaxID=2648921 RepID=UPI000D738F16|nr:MULTISPECIES: folate-binding protein YgfZ [unclassified Caulobacter]PXA84456.1 glycine cleavage system protein T [Caulobacter sp. D5]PXA92710.1 glycine cleavage system protein T [Caulobacter sp. D4A]